MARKFDLLRVSQAQNLFEPSADAHQDRLPLLRAPTLARGLGVRLADGTGPEANAVEALTDVDDDPHDLVVFFALEGLTNRSEHDVQPKLVDGNGALIFEAVCPFAPVLILRVFPLGTHAVLEEMIIGFEREFRRGCDVVLSGANSVEVMWNGE